MGRQRGRREFRRAAACRWLGTWASLGHSVNRWTRAEARSSWASSQGRRPVKRTAPESTRSSADASTSDSGRTVPDQGETRAGFLGGYSPERCQTRGQLP